MTALRQQNQSGLSLYLCSIFPSGGKATSALDAALVSPVLLQPLQVPEPSLLQDLQTRPQSVLLLLQILQLLNLNREKARWHAKIWIWAVYFIGTRWLTCLTISLIHRGLWTRGPEALRISRANAEQQEAFSSFVYSQWGYMRFKWA